MDDQNSIGTNTTGTSNAIELILVGGIETQFDGINMDGERLSDEFTHGNDKEYPATST